MKLKFFAAVFAALFISSGHGMQAQSSASRDYRQAVRLYNHGMYERACAMFDELSLSEQDVMSEGYSVLCSVRMQTQGYSKRVDAYSFNYPYSVLLPQIRYYSGLNLFDKESYAEAAEELSRINPDLLYSDQLPEFLFKKSYSLYINGDYPKASEGFRKIDGMAYSDYTAPARYSLGYISYYDKRFSNAFDYFEKASKDPRFTQLSHYYMLECRFMQKDYAYVVNEGPGIYELIPSDRKPHLARIISESYLVRGNSAKANEYYSLSSGGKESKSRADYYYAGSVLYAVKDYAGAIDSFTKMTDRSDSLGQAADYQMGYCYIQTKNKVAAMDAFKAASGSSYDAKIQDDAYFNYAKLAFDLNHDTSAFTDYIARSGKEKNDKIYGYMAVASLYNHDYAGAVAAYDKIDNLDEGMKSNYIKAYYLRADQLISNGSYKDAIPCLKAVAYYTDRHDRLNQLSRYWIAESYFRSGDYAQAKTAFNDLYNISALDGMKESQLIPYDIAYCYFKNAEYPMAAKWFDNYLSRSEPQYGKDASLRRADCDFIQKDYKKSVEAYSGAVKRFGFDDDMYPYYRLGIAYGLEGNKSRRIESLSKVLKVSPQVPFYSETLYELGRSYVDSDRIAEAESSFSKLLTTTGDSTFIAKSLIELGMIERNRHDYDKSLIYFKKVVSEMPGTEYKNDAMLAIESVYQAKGEPYNYLDYAESVGADKGMSASEKEAGYFNAAEQIFLTENFQQAITALDNYQNKYPSGAQKVKADYYLAECYRNLGNKEKALEYYSKVSDSNAVGNFVSKSRFSYANLSYSMEHFDDAYDIYSELKNSSASSTDKLNAREGMMRSAYKGGSFEKAIESASEVKAMNSASVAQLREADYISAKSYLATSQRDKAFALFKELSSSPKTDEGAEASYMIIQDTYDKGNFSDVEAMVYKFSDKAGGQNYWLAKAFVVLGDTFVENDNLKQAEATFRSVLDGYKSDGRHPDDITDNVRMRLDKLSKLEEK